MNAKVKIIAALMFRLTTIALLPISHGLKATSSSRTTKAEGSLPKFHLEKDRYRLYAAKSCPFAHRVRLVRLLHGLEDSIEMTYVTGQTSESFTFDEPEPEFKVLTLKELYAKADPAYEGKATVPMLLDKTNQKLVNNESLDLALGLAAQCKSDDLNLMQEGTEHLAKDISSKVSVAVYKFLFNPDKDAKQKIADELWSEFEKYNQLLDKQPFVCGDKLSIADLVLWASVIRFDNVYARQFGLKGKTILKDYPSLSKFAARVWKMKSKKGDTTLGDDASMDEIIRMYWESGNLAPKAGNDPKAAAPEVLPVF